jgi:hypothetical protein
LFVVSGKQNNNNNNKEEDFTFVENLGYQFG